MHELCCLWSDKQFCDKRMTVKTYTNYISYSQVGRERERERERERIPWWRDGTVTGEAWLITVKPVSTREPSLSINVTVISSNMHECTVDTHTSHRAHTHIQSGSPTPMHTIYKRIQLSLQSQLLHSQCTSDSSLMFLMWVKKNKHTIRPEEVNDTEDVESTAIHTSALQFHRDLSWGFIFSV